MRLKATNIQSSIPSKQRSLYDIASSKCKEKTKRSRGEDEIVMFADPGNVLEWIECLGLLLLSRRLDV